MGSGCNKQTKEKSKNGEITITEGKLARRRYVASVPQGHVLHRGTCRKPIMIEASGAGCQMYITSSPGIQRPV